MNIPVIENQNIKLKELVYDKINELQLSQEYIDRVEKELSIIINKDFAGYFLIVADYVNYAKERNIKIGPGRGSCVSSLVSYLLNITEIDPIQYNLMFERFLSEDRMEIPDIDVDIENRKREQLFMYLINTYGYNHVARFLDNSKQSMHSSGVVISNLNLIKADTKEENNMLVLQNTQEEVEEVLVKFDILSSKVLSIIKELETMTGDIVSIRDNNFNDTNIFKLLNTSLTAGIFQVSSSLYKERLPKLHINSIEELANALALIRAPFLSIKADVQYINYNQKRIHPIYDEITKNTNGILLYQEQLISLLCAFNFSLQDAYTMMKLLAKGKSINTYREFFFSQCNAHAKEIWNIITVMGLYSFNKAHAIAYATLVYVTAYYKIYYTKEFYAVMLTKAYKDKDVKAIQDIQKEMKQMRIKLLPVDFNMSKYNCVVEDNHIRLGLVSITGIGEKAAKQLLATKSLYENKDMRTLIPAIFAGVFDSIYKESRYSIYKNFALITGRKVEKEFSLSKFVNFNKDASNEMLDKMLMKII